MEALAWQGWLTLGVIVLVLGAMVRGIGAPDVILMGGLFILATAGVLTPAETFAGFSNQAMLTVGALFVLSAAMRHTGALELTLGRLFGRARTERGGLTRICPPLAGLSAFMNNAPIVAMMTPLVIDWARRHNVAPSRLLIPLSYSTILGSIITVIGTSVTLTVAGLVLQSDMEPIGFFELAPVGIPVCLVGLVYLLLVAPRLLPDRTDPAEAVGEHRREYTVAMRVDASCPLVNRSVEDAGLRHLPGLFLVEIERDDSQITPVGPDEIIRTGDLLIFAGVVSTIVDLQRIRGLVPEPLDDDPGSTDPRHHLIEAVVSRSSPLVGLSIRESNFRTVYDAAVVAVHRNGERVPGKIGAIVLRAGDTLLLQGGPGFLRAHRNSPDFYLVSEIPESSTPRHERAWLTVGVFITMVLVAALGILPISIASFVAVGVLIGTRCITGTIARRSIQLHVLAVIAAGLGLAKAMDKTGAAEAVANVLVSQAALLSPLAALVVVYLVTTLLAEMLHHNASAALMFPVAVAAAGLVDAEPRAFIMAVILGAACSFASPVTYQTHLLVYGPGGYRFKDFIKVGLPLNAICAVVALYLIPRVWPL